jgi:hypothetical protein
MKTKAQQRHLVAEQESGLGLFPHLLIPAGHLQLELGEPWVTRPSAAIFIVVDPAKPRCRQLSDFSHLLGPGPSDIGYHRGAVTPQSPL